MKENILGYPHLFSNVQKYASSNILVQIFFNYCLCKTCTLLCTIWFRLGFVGGGGDGLKWIRRLKEQ